MSNARTLANTINASSQIVVPSGGIAFTDLDSSNDAATANEAYVMGQNGYEEGTFTPTLTPESGSITLNAVGDVLTYTKIGGLVHIQGGLNNLTPSSATGNITLSNLPFPSANRADNSGRAGPIFYFSAMNGSGNHDALADINVVAPSFLGENVAQVIINCKAEYLKTDNSSDLYVCFSYQTDS